MTGTGSAYSKFILQDTSNHSLTKLEAKDNVLNHAIIGTVNLRNSGEANDILGSNSFSTDSCFVEAVEPGNIDFYTVYEVPEYRLGYWALTGIDDFDVDWGRNPDGSTAFIQQIVDEANRNGSTRLALTGIDENNIIKTFTWFKDGIYWYDYVGGLEVSKKVTGTVTNEKFSFTVTLNDRNINATYGDMTFVDGVATFELADGESIYAEDMPAGLTYTVAEAKNGQFNTTYTGNTGTIAKGQVSKCVVTNAVALPNPDQNDPINSMPETGDSSSLALWMCLMAVSGAAFMFAGKRRTNRG